MLSSNLTTASLQISEDVMVLNEEGEALVERRGGELQ